MCKYIIHISIPWGLYLWVTQVCSLVFFFLEVGLDAILTANVLEVFPQALNFWHDYVAHGLAVGVLLF